MLGSSTRSRKSASGRESGTPTARGSAGVQRIAGELTAVGSLARPVYSSFQRRPNRLAPLRDSFENRPIWLRMRALSAIRKLRDLPGRPYSASPARRRTGSGQRSSSSTKTTVDAPEGCIHSFRSAGMTSRFPLGRSACPEPEQEQETSRRPTGVATLR